MATSHTSHYAGSQCSDGCQSENTHFSLDVHSTQTGHLPQGPAAGQTGDTRIMIDFASTQTDISLPHTMRYIMWSPSCYESVAEIEVCNASEAETSAPNTCSSVLDTDVIIEDDRDCDHDDDDESGKSNLFVSIEKVGGVVPEKADEGGKSNSLSKKQVAGVVHEKTEKNIQV